MVEKYHAGHQRWSGPFKLYSNGRFSGGGHRPNGGWDFDTSQTKLRLTWDDWPKEELQKTSTGFAQNDFFLEKSEAEFHGFWTGFRPLTSMFKKLAALPIKVGSASGHRSSELYGLDLMLSKRNAAVRRGGDLFYWKWRNRSGSSRWWVGLPRLDHPQAFYLPWFYPRWTELLPQPRSSGPKESGIGFTMEASARGTVKGALARRSLELAIYLSRWFTVAGPVELRAHFDRQSRALFYEAKDKEAVISQYQFNLCFEDESAPGHLTEGLFEALYAGAIPLYAGDIHASEWFDSSGYLDCLNLSPEQVAETVSKLSQNGQSRWVNEQRELLCKIPLEEMTSRWEKFVEKFTDESELIEPLPRLANSSINKTAGAIPRILIGICSCRRNADKRAAVRETWIQHLADGISAVFFVGRGTQEAEDDVISLPVEDDYLDLPKKVQSFFRHALEHYEFDYLFKCDDDSYVCSDRLFKLVANAPDYMGNDGHIRWSGYGSGGAGYFLSKNAVALIARAPTPPEGPEDVWVGKLMKESGISPVPSTKLRPNYVEFPTAFNDLATAHWCSPEVLRAIHQTIVEPKSLRAVMSFQAMHPAWSGSFRLLESRLFVGGGSWPHGRWEFTNDGEFLILNWFFWPKDVLHRTDSGYANAELKLELS